MSDLPDGYKKQFLTSTELDEKHVDVTDAETELEFDSLVHSWYAKSEGPNTVYVSGATGVSTDSMPLFKREGFGANKPLTKLYFICASGQTATVKAWGLR